MDKKIPDKLYFKIGEVARLADVETHVLRYWETEFPGIRPKRANSRQRLYRRQDVEYILKIKSLLHRDGYTIAGARKFLESEPARPAVTHPAKARKKEVTSPPAVGNATGKLKIIKKELLDLQELLKKD